MSAAVPIGFVRYQREGLRLLRKITLRSVIPSLRPAANPEIFARRSIDLEPPPGRLIDAFAQWCGAPATRYAETLPPHLFMQWGAPLVGAALLETRYRLLGMINQGCSMEVHAPLARGRPLRVTASVQTLEEDSSKARLVHQIETSQGDELGVRATLATIFLLGKSPRKPAPPPVAADRAVGRWSAHRRDGWRFALLTGDFNPLHWCWPLARLSPFRGMVLHGFGTFARSYELLLNTDREVSTIDVKFTHPVALPSAELVLSETVAAPHRLTLVDAATGRLKMVGRYA